MPTIQEETLADLDLSDKCRKNVNKDEHERRGELMAELHI